jgi:hypothetical protein
MKAIVLLLVVASCLPEAGNELSYDDPARRKELLEITLRALDEHPELVDELFRASLLRPATLDRLFASTARSLGDGDLARRMALELVAHPSGLRRVMIETFDAARSSTEARRALSDAIELRADMTVELLAGQPEQLSTLAMTIVQRAIEEPATQKEMRKFVKRVGSQARAGRRGYARSSRAM